MRAKIVRERGNLTVSRIVDLQTTKLRRPPIVKSQVADRGTKKDKGQSKKAIVKMIVR